MFEHVKKIHDYLLCTLCRKGGGIHQWGYDLAFWLQCFLLKSS